MFLWLISKEFFVDSFSSGFGDSFTFFSTWVGVGFRFVCVGFLHGVCCTFLCRHSYRICSSDAFFRHSTRFFRRSGRLHIVRPKCKRKNCAHVDGSIQKSNTGDHGDRNQKKSQKSPPDTNGQPRRRNDRKCNDRHQKKATTLQKHQPLKYFYEEFQQQTRQRKIPYNLR